MPASITWTAADAGVLPPVAEQMAAWNELSAKAQRHDLIMSGTDPRDWQTGRVPNDIETEPTDTTDEHGDDVEMAASTPSRGPPTWIVEQRAEQRLPPTIIDPAVLDDVASLVEASR